MADARTLVEKARTESQGHRFSYNEPMTTESCAQSVCDYALQFGEEGAPMSRPFGVALLIAGVDEHGARLFQTDPSGTFTQFEAKAIGAGSEGAQTNLQDKYNKSMTLEEAESLALSTLKQVMEEKINSKNAEIAVVTTDSGKFRLYSTEELERIVERL